MNSSDLLADVGFPPSAAKSESDQRDSLGSIALDQWRGLALVMVLISHGFYFTGRTHGIGRVGVNLFFFISGVLVFRSLSRSRAVNNQERTLSFWRRRLRRLYPAVITYILVMTGGMWALQHLPNLPPNSDLLSYVKAIPWALGYVVNYLPAVPNALGHLWSLGCEMQFYLLAPILYGLGGTTVRRRNLVFGTALFVLFGLGLSQPFIGRWRYHFEFAVWPMMFGFCCEYKRHWFEQLSQRVVTLIFRLSFILCGGCVGLMCFGLENKILVIAIGALLILPCWLGYFFGRPMSGIAGRLLKWIGIRTYSIYLWQQPFTICDFLPAVIRPLGAVVSIAVGGLWFHLFERPFLSTNRRNVGS